jgi:protein-tyrosine-phosphatase
MIGRSNALQYWRIGSAGTWAREGQPVLPEAQLIAQERGLDLHAHRSHCVTAEMLSSYRLILTMEEGHKEALQIEFAASAERIYMLSEMAGVRANVRDPLDGSLADYRQMAQEIDNWLRLGLERIKRLAMEYSIA